MPIPKQEIGEERGIGRMIVFHVLTSVDLILDCFISLFSPPQCMSNYFSTVSNKKRRKKRIRRILDDAELREETKEKIAIEKVDISQFVISFA